MSYLRWSVTAQFLRLPAMMAPLAFALLATQMTGSYRLGGVMMAVFITAEILVAGPVGRLLDLFGVARGLRVLLVVSAFWLCGLTLVASSPVLTIVLVVLTGFAAGGLSGGIRALLPKSVAPGFLERAVAIDAVVIEIVVVSGPLVVALLTPLGVVAPVLGMAGAYLLAVLFVPTVAAAPRARGERPKLGSIMIWLMSSFGFGVLISTIEVSSLPFAQRLGGGPEFAVVFMVVLIAASMAGAGLYAWGGPAITVDRSVRTAFFLVVMAVGGVLVAFGNSWPLLIAGLVTVGVCTGPLNTTISMHVQLTLPESRKAEGFSLVFTAQAGGFALGSLCVALLPVIGAPLVGSAVALIAAFGVISAHRGALYRRVTSAVANQEARS
ncbi:MFS transporter [Kibdelosporangium philippinense]|uniref:MFS transporter n=1 Tax=Kibdelosporangium philippinense TaxID=211113 RepID=A0ABS8ZDM5_9PSEU|nr:MFS transporter [Kibdelosporangium philippinense]MCE7005334.1 MFS transporter [Kibdelosporangium philippinense]